MQRSFLLLVAALVLSPLTYAQAPAERSAPADLQSLFEVAWERSVALQTAEGRRQEAAASRIQADSLIAGPPVADLRHRGDRFTDGRGVRESEVALGVPIWLPGQRAARGELADAQLAEADARARLARLAVAGELRDRVWQLAAAAAEQEVLRRRVLNATSLRDDVARRVSAGDLARTDLLLADQDLLATRALLTDSQARMTELSTRLFQLTGASALPLRYEERPAMPEAVSAHPSLEAAAGGLLRAQRQLGYLQKSRRDAPEVGVSYRRDAAGGGAPSDQTVGVFIRIPFATDARNLPRETAAQTEVMTARAERERMERVVQSEAEASRQALTLVEQQLKLSEQRSAMLAERAVLLRKTFDAGEIGLTEVLRAQNQALEAEADAARQRARRGAAIANLKQALGVLP
ncbi:TolC family protein [Cupriavidus nantongensis]|nr:TolC family protein [Cupriavidus nantongensis]